jgi:hypothetical protein
MATVTHTFYLPDGSTQKALPVVFETWGGPWFRITGATSNARIVSTTNATTGVLSQTLLEGVYSITWRSGIANTWSQKFIGVPVGTDSYQLDDLELTDTTKIIFRSATIVDFTTVADMLYSDATQWEQAQCFNYNGGDGILTIWIRAIDQSILPNGTDVLQTYRGVTIVRVFVREGDGGAVVPGGGLGTYTVEVPLTVPTVADLRASLFDAILVWVGDPTDPIAFRKGNENALDDGVNGVMNAANIHYDRIRFV